MHVIFVEPAFPANQRHFVRALAEAGAKVTAIGEASADLFSREMRSWLHAYEQVPSVVHEPSLLAAVRRIQEREWVDRLEATVEAHIMPTARVREASLIPGTSVRTAYLCRDKPAMKECLRQAGVPCAQSIGSADLEEISAFADSVGFPLIVKPRAGAGASGTTRVDNRRELEQALAEAGLTHGQSVAVEEFIEGHEGFYDTLTLNGEVVHDFASHYYPGVLEAMRTRSVSPQFLTTNRIDTAAGYQEAKELGRRVIKALGIGTSATHMEWFASPKGLKFSEIGCRPPGVGAWDLYCASNEMDVYREWAELIVNGRPTQRPTRRFAAGILNLRPTQDGRIVAYEGIEAVLETFGDLLIDHHLPPVGSPTQPVNAGYMANAWIRLKHPDYDELRRIMTLIGERVTVHAR